MKVTFTGAQGTQAELVKVFVRQEEVWNGVCAADRGAGPMTAQ